MIMTCYFHETTLFSDAAMTQAIKRYIISNCFIRVIVITSSARRIALHVRGFKRGHD
jgi:hypothetical protein